METCVWLLIVFSVGVCFFLFGWLESLLIETRNDWWRACDAESRRTRATFTSSFTQFRFVSSEILSKAAHEYSLKEKQKNTVKKIYSKTVNWLTVSCLQIHNEKYALYVFFCKLFCNSCAPLHSEWAKDPHPCGVWHVYG